METAGLCIFSLIVLSQKRNFMRSIFMMNGIFIVPLFYLTIKEFRKSRCVQGQGQTATNRPEAMELNQNHAGQEALLPDAGAPEQKKYRSWISMVLFGISSLFSLGGIVLLIFLVSK